ncbi:MAG TPA: hypothetical protein VGL23_05515, partial [Chloroflexota bacterium]
MPLDFVENRGQWEVPAKFVARRGSLAAAFDDNAIRLNLGSAHSALGLTFEGASPDATLVGEGERGGRYSYFIGDDPTKWRSQVASYGGLLYRGLYEGVDLRVTEDGDQLRYDLLLAPGADVGQIVVRADGADRPSIADDGSLVLQTASGPLRQSPPLTWEELPDGLTRRLESRFRIIDAQRYGFEALGHDPRLALVIDPGLDWATFLGGSGDETVEGLAIVTDGTGDIVVAGQTWSPDFPRTGGNLGPTGMTPYVARLNASGTALVYATLFGGTFNHSVKHVALDASNRPVVVGDTNSLDFPTTPGAFDRTPPDGMRGDYDAYVIKFNATGSGLVFSTYLGGSPGSGLDQAWRVGHDPAGSVTVAGITTSPDFPTTPGAFDRTLAGRDIFIARLDPTGSQLTYSTFLGGEASEDVFGMVVDGQGFVTLTGQTFSTTFPVTPDAFDPTYNGFGDAFVARLKLDGAGAADLKYSTFLGGAQYIEAGNGIALDPNNPQLVTVSGFTRSGDFPTTAGALLRTHFAPVDTRMAFVARFHFPAAAPGQLVWSTFYGAPGNQSADDVVVDSTGAAIIVGGTAANNPPTTERAFDRIPGAGYGVGFPEGKADGYVARISADGGRVLYCTLLGGSYSDTVSHVAYAGGTSVVVAGLTSSPDFPVTAGAFDTVYASDGKPSGNATLGSLAADAFVARLTLDAPVTGDITPPPAPDLLGPPVGATFDYPGRNLTLDWSDVADPSGVAAYHLQFSPNAGFVNDFNAELNGWFEPWLPTSVAVFTVGHSGTFFWRVQALDRAGNLGPWSAVRSLTVASSTPAAPNLLSPPDAGQFAPGAVAFAWAAAAGAKTYELEVDTTSTFTGAGKTFVSGITQLQQTLSLTAETTYWWHVRGVSEVTVGPWSTVRSFRIKRGSPPAPAPPPSTSPPPGPATALAGLTLGADVVFGAGTVSGTVTLNGAAPAGGATVALASNYPNRAAVPASVTVLAGSTSATFSVTTAASTQFTQVMISGEYGAVTQGGVLQVYASDPVVDLDNFTVSTTTLLGGDTVQGTVSILFTFTAGPGGALVTLGSTNPALASVPASVTIPPGTNTASFVITTQPVTTATTVTIFASRSRTIGVALELLPPGALSSLSLNPTTVTGGQSSQGTVTLASPAPAGGVVVALSSSNSAVATVPASVGVPAGAASASFTV